MTADCIILAQAHIIHMRRAFTVGQGARDERQYKRYSKLTGMVGIVKWLRARVVAPVYVCSNPTTHPINVGVSPSGKATDSDSVMRRFESCYPSQFLQDAFGHLGYGDIAKW